MNPTCSSLADFAVWELEAYADGEEMAHVAAFVRDHPEEWASWQQRQIPAARLNQVLFRYDCPSLDQLRSYSWLELATAEQQAITVHLQQCPHCAAEVQSFTNFLAGERPEESLMPEGRGPALIEQLQQWAERLRIVIAQLAPPPDMRLAPAVALRSDESPTSVDRPALLLYETEVADLNLMVYWGERGGLTLAGQVFSDHPLANATCRLIPAQPDQEPLSAAVDDNGAFHIDQQPPGEYQLLLMLKDALVVIPQLVLA